MRRFSAERLTLCDDFWFGRVLTSDGWTVLGFVGEGESEAIRIENPKGMLAIAKLRRFEERRTLQSCA